MAKTMTYRVGGVDYEVTVGPWWVYSYHRADEPSIVITDKFPSFGWWFIAIIRPFWRIDRDRHFTIRKRGPS
jgi:hypothetical protein